MSEHQTDTFVCVECGQTITRIIPRPAGEPALCALCLTMPGWFTVPALAELQGYDASCAPSITARRCRLCGCTQNTACLTDEGPCYWIEEDLCSGCLDREEVQ